MARPKKNILHSLPPSTRFNDIIAAAGEHGAVEVSGVGVFRIVDIPRKVAFHNFSGRNRVIAAYRKLKFEQSPLLKNTLTTVL